MGILSQKSGAISRQQVHTLLKQYGRAANISVAPHPAYAAPCLRLFLADLGRDTRLIQDYLGHRNISHTVIYTASNFQTFSANLGSSPRIIRPPVSELFSVSRKQALFSSVICYFCDCGHRSDFRAAYYFRAQSM